MMSFALKLFGSKIFRGLFLSVVMLLAGHFGVKFLSDVSGKIHGHDQAIADRDLALQANAELRAENDQLNARMEADRQRDTKLRQEFYEREYEEINRYKEEIKDLESALSVWHHLALPDDIKRMRERKGTVHSQQRIPEVTD